MAQTVIQPAEVDRNGNIQINGQNEIYLPIKRFSDTTLGAQIDISGIEMVFRVQGLDDVDLIPDPHDAQGLLLSIQDIETYGLVISMSRQFPFVLLDPTQSPPVVWEGLICLHGW